MREKMGAMTPTEQEELLQLQSEWRLISVLDGDTIDVTIDLGI